MIQTRQSTKNIGTNLQKNFYNQKLNEFIFLARLLN